MRLLLASFLPTSFQRVPGFFPRSGPVWGALVGLGVWPPGALVPGSPGPRSPGLLVPGPWSPGPLCLCFAKLLKNYNVHGLVLLVLC